MNKPKNTLVFKEADFRSWLDRNSFAKSGDTYEQKYHGLVLPDFPRNEEFWRFFVVPLTNRIDSKNTNPVIHFRDGVDDRLQYICGANYSLFIHLAMASNILNNWSDAALDGIYARLASALDVFEALAIQFHLVINDCQGKKSALIDELKLDEFLGLAKSYYQSEYAKLHEYYIKIGKKVPPINIPTKDSILNEILDGHPQRSEYFTLSGQIRSLRNAIVHDVRVGMLSDQDGNLLIPKPSAVSNYRQWSKVLAVAGDHARINKDFCEVKTQCSSDIQRLKQILNELFGSMLEQFKGDFVKDAASTLREVFGIQFQNDGGIALPVILPEPAQHDSSSFKTIYPGVSGVASSSGTGMVSVENIII